MESFKKETKILLLPSLFIFIVLGLFPTIWSIYLSLKKYNLTEPFDVEFIFFKNYINLLQDQRLYSSIANTFIFLLFSIFLSLILGLILAICLKKIKKFRTIIYTFLIVPFVLPPAVIAYNFKFMMNYDFGIFNTILLSIFSYKINFLGETSSALFSLIFIDIWQWTPFVTIILFSVLISLNPDPIEAAKIDGASNFQIFWFIIMPIIKPFIILVFLLRFIDVIKVYEIINLVTSGGPGTSTETINIYLSRIAFDWFDLGYSCALSIVLINIIIILTKKILKIFES